MERKDRYVAGIVLAGALLAFASRAPAHEHSWLLLREADDRAWYINTSTMVDLPSETVSIWSKVVPRKGSALFRENRSALERAGRKYDRFEFTQRLEEVDCAGSRHRTLSELYYDRDERIILSRSTPRAQWVSVSPDSGAKRLHAAVCERTARSATLDTAGIVASADR